MDVKEFRELLEKARDGDAGALGALINNYRPYLRALARDQLDSAVNARVDASDLVQQTCLEIHRDFQAFRGEVEGELLAWVKRILANNAANAVRHHIYAKKRSIDKERPLDDGRPSAVIDKAAANRQSTPSVKAMRQEQAERLTAMLELLPEDQREAVRLRHLEGWTMVQISEHFGRSEVAVAGLLKRGMKKLRSHLAEDERP